jgi:hypothetical protein
VDEQLLQNVSANGFIEAVVVSSAWTGFFIGLIWRQQRRWWHWPLLAPLALFFIALLTLIFGLAVFFGAALFKIDLGASFRKFWEQVLWFLDQPAFPSPRVWHIFTGFTILAAALGLFLWRRRRTGAVATASAELEAEADESPPLAGREPEKRLPAKPVVRKERFGVLWEQAAGGKVVPICPRGTCHSKMQLLREGPQRQGMIITAQDRGPRNVFLKCSNPGCQFQVPTNTTESNVRAEVSRLFDQPDKN